MKSFASAGGFPCHAEKIFRPEDRPRPHSAADHHVVLLRTTNQEVIQGSILHVLSDERHLRILVRVVLLHHHPEQREDVRTAADASHQDDLLGDVRLRGHEDLHGDVDVAFRGDVGLPGAFGSGLREVTRQLLLLVVQPEGGGSLPRAGNARRRDFRVPHLPEGAAPDQVVQLDVVLLHPQPRWDVQLGGHRRAIRSPRAARASVKALGARHAEDGAGHSRDRRPARLGNVAAAGAGQLFAEGRSSILPVPREARLGSRRLLEGHVVARGARRRPRALPLHIGPASALS
mmetsp:Transcript_15793/g.60118  ORF Transcript_15793/g.60118 Transcript_15793/m.60118 type:complete len:289 (+) Transcript_15793:3354-4220(+)